MNLSESQLERYGRQLILPEVGATGQQRLAQARVLLVGAGGLGSPAAWYLAAAGVGTLGLVDSETVELSNLHRQILHSTRDLGVAKTASAKTKLEALNPETRVRAYHERLTAQRADALVAEYDVILDGSDNIPTRYLVNDICVLVGKPLVHGGIVGFDGQLLTVIPRRSACFRCLFPEPPRPEDIPSCQQAGVLGSVAGTIGSLMAHEALKLVLGVGEPLTNRLLVLEGKTSRFREVPVRRRAGCEVCSETPTVRTIHDIENDTQACAGAAVSDREAQGGI